LVERENILLRCRDGHLKQKELCPSAATLEFKGQTIKAIVQMSDFCAVDGSAVCSK
jgi:hypothetical protein